jgi:type II secretory pathway pseudopilin PulG
MSIVELLVALLILAIGILAIGGIFPSGSRAQLGDRMITTANLFAQQKMEELRGQAFNASTLDIGRHPAGTATEALGNSGAWQRWYEVSTVPSMNNLKQVTVFVSWVQVRPHQVSTTTYLRR